MKVLIMSDMEGVSGIVAWSPGERGRPHVRGGATPVHGGDQRCRAWRQECEIVVVDCHGAGGDWSFNSLVPELLDEGCDWVARLGSLYGTAGAGL